MTTRVEQFRASPAPWLMGGLLALGCLLLVTWRLGQLSSPAEALAAKATRVDLVQRLRAVMAAASEAELRAVLSRTDQDAAKEAGEARALGVELDRDRQALGQLLAAGGSSRELELLGDFTRRRATLETLDEEVLTLATRNTNLQAFTLAFGPAAQALETAGAALSRLAQRQAAARDGVQVLQAALGARVALLQIHALLAPHIAEASEERMDGMERRIASAEAEAEGHLLALAALPGLARDGDLATAREATGRYRQVLVRILALSRENTNVRSVALSLDQRRAAMSACLAALDALEQAVLEEHIPGVAYGRPMRAR